MCTDETETETETNIYDMIVRVGIIVLIAFIIKTCTETNIKQTEMRYKYIEQGESK